MVSGAGFQGRGHSVVWSLICVAPLGTDLGTPAHFLSLPWAGPPKEDHLPGRLAEERGAWMKTCLDLAGRPRAAGPLSAAGPNHVLFRPQTGRDRGGMAPVRLTSLLTLGSNSRLQLFKLSLPFSEGKRSYIIMARVLLSSIASLFNGWTLKVLEAPAPFGQNPQILLLFSNACPHNKNLAFEALSLPFPSWCWTVSTLPR